MSSLSQLMTKSGQVAIILDQLMTELDQLLTSLGPFNDHFE